MTKPNYIKLSIVLALGAGFMFFQNCSNVNFNPAEDLSSTNKVESSNLVIATNQNGDQTPVPIISNPTITVENNNNPEETSAVMPSQSPSSSSMGKAPSMNSSTSSESTTASPTPMPVIIAEEVCAAGDGKCKTEVEDTQYFAHLCGVDFKTIHNFIDLAKLNEPDLSKLDLNIKGKTLIYTSDGELSLKKINISKASGRVIICNVKFLKICDLSGRLDMLNENGDSVKQSHTEDCDKD